jgi:hypothetical protein
MEVSMKRIAVVTAIAIAAVTVTVARASAQTATPPPAPGAQTPVYPPAQPAPAEPPRMELSLSGFYEFNGYSQNNFFLGKNASGGVTDSDAYMIQLFRFQPEITYGTAIKGVIRMDAAQKILGFDNEQRDTFRPGFSNLFNNKDTNFLLHLDWAYVELSPRQFNGWALRLGRMKNQLGNMLVLDQDGDGVQVTRAFAGGRWRVTAAWTKQWEGADSLTDDRYTGGVDGRDADLFYLDLSGRAGRFTVNPYVAFYNDDNATPYIPNLLQYSRPRFTPNLSQAFVGGFAFNGPIGKGTLRGEFAALTGKDDIRNPHSGAGQINDVNDGDLRGATAYLDLKVPAGKSTLGALFGFGTGDDDPMSGKGNLVKIRTNGFFYVSEVWEDSIMPDEEGITPQGLGSPGSRAYREFENTTLVQVNLVRPLTPQFRLTLAASVMRATEALRPWADANGNGFIEPGEFGSASSNDLGKEADFMLDWLLMPNLTWTLRGGYMWAGDAAGYLINGTNRFNDHPWELRTTVRFNFGGLRLR